MKKILQSGWIELLGLVVAIIIGRESLYSFFQELCYPITKFDLTLSSDYLRIIHISIYILLFCAAIFGYRVLRNIFRHGCYKDTWKFFVVAGTTFVLSIIERAFVPSTLIIELILMMLFVLAIIFFIYKLALMAYYSERV